MLDDVVQKLGFKKIDNGKSNYYKKDNLILNIRAFISGNNGTKPSYKGILISTTTGYEIKIPKNALYRNSELKFKSDILSAINEMKLKDEIILSVDLNPKRYSKGNNKRDFKVVHNEESINICKKIISPFSRKYETSNVAKLLLSLSDQYAKNEKSMYFVSFCYCTCSDIIYSLKKDRLYLIDYLREVLYDITDEFPFIESNKELFINERQKDLRYLSSKGLDYREYRNFKIHSEKIKMEALRKKLVERMPDSISNNIISKIYDEIERVIVKHKDCSDFNEVIGIEPKYYKLQYDRSFNEDIRVNYTKVINELQKI